MADAHLGHGRRIAAQILSWLHLRLVSCTRLQSLWAGYGHVYAVVARRHPPTDAHHHDNDDDADADVHLILKIVAPPPNRQDDEGHWRKLISYQVEQFFYHDIAPTLRDVPMAKCLASTTNLPQHQAETAGLGNVQFLLLTDLRLEYPVAGEGGGGKRACLTPRQANSAIQWLARFHRSYWKQHDAARRQRLDKLVPPPLQEQARRKAGHEATRGIWLNGGYTYLATRRSELASLASDAESEWAALLCKPVKAAASSNMSIADKPPKAASSNMSIAELAAAFLTPRGRAIETYLHGDVKSENMFSSTTGDDVAFFDFQYVGIGIGACDLAKLLTCSVPLEMLTCRPHDVVDEELGMSEQEVVLLKRYREELLLPPPLSMDDDGSSPAAPAYDWPDLKRHWETALVDWCRFQASWGFWGNTQWLQARVRSIVRDPEWLEWLVGEVGELQSGQELPRVCH